MIAEVSKRSKRVLVLCTGNSARSQMAAGLLRSFGPKLEVVSAGTEPASRVNPYAVVAMKEVGIDVSEQRPQSVALFTGQAFDYVITVCGEADRNCPAFEGKVGQRIHIGFIDPAAASGSDQEVMAVFRQVREEIRERFSEFYREEIGKGL